MPYGVEKIKSHKRKDRNHHNTREYSRENSGAPLFCNIFCNIVHDRSWQSHSAQNVKTKLPPLVTHKISTESIGNSGLQFGISRSETLRRLLNIPDAPQRLGCIESGLVRDKNRLTFKLDCVRLSSAQKQAGLRISQRGIVLPLPSLMRANRHVLSSIE